MPLPEDENRDTLVQRKYDDHDLPPSDSIGWVTAVIQVLGTHRMLIEEEPDDWYIDDRGVFQERGRERTEVQDMVYCGISTILNYEPNK